MAYWLIVATGYRYSETSPVIVSWSCGSSDVYANPMKPLLLLVIFVCLLVPDQMIEISPSEPANLADGRTPLGQPMK